jgi:D-3-phosphoglycerate dehydrogenase
MPGTATSYPKHKIKVLLLESIHPTAQASFRDDGLNVAVRSSALGEAELAEAVADVHLLGIRSKTRVTEAVLESARRLLSIGCFCIGTNQVDVAAANRRGVPVFNAPFSNTRSVAELVLCEIVALSRRLADRSRSMHEGKWQKGATGSFEVRGKTLGIVGYGHIGSQVGVLAEAMGLGVVFYDVMPRLPMGNNRGFKSLGEVLAKSDFVTLHVPATPQTKGMIDARALSTMKRGAYLLNLSRGDVVDIGALARALGDGRLGGAAVDVFPEEPESNAEPFQSELRGLPNVILTPHVGGSTEEAQEAIGKEVAGALIKFLDSGATTGAVNFPEVEPQQLRGRHRILNVHKNVPGVLGDINRIVGEVRANVESQILATDPEIGYLVMDLNQSVSDEVRERMTELQTNIRTRILY